MDQATFLQTKKLSSVAIEAIPALVWNWWQEDKAFGIGYYPESKSVKISHCEPDQLIELKSVDELIDLQSDYGFAVFPFNLELNRAFFIPNYDENLLPNELQTEGNKRNQLKPDTGLGTQDSYFQKQVAEAVSAIRNNQFSKLVLSRNAVYNFDNLDIKSLVGSLFEHYSNAHIIIFNLPGNGLWISASPEILVQQVGKNLMKTVALAGTMAFHGQELKGQGWTEKEIEEQALVSRFIKTSLKKVNFHLYEEKGPATVQAGNLLHLRTDFLVHSADVEDFGRLADELHPTSAVCGSPKNEAFEWLAKHEDFDREYFSGCAGPIEPLESKLVVLLRSGKITRQQITLYAGAGITSASDPLKEWEETEEKLKTLLAFTSNSKAIA